MIAFTAVDVAEHMTFVKEATNHNDGTWVEAILRVVGCKRGDPWCCAAVSFCLQIEHAGHNPLPMTASCETLHQYGKLHGLLVKEPRRGDIFLVLNAEGRAHHTGFCTDVATAGKVPTVEGNTNADGSRDGWGWLRRTRSLSPSLVFLRPSEAP